MENLNKIILEKHNPNLVKRDESPNGNIQTLIFNDGEIVSTKGGWAFLQRSFFQIRGSLNVNVQMPCKYGDFSYAIVENEDDALEIRSYMENIVKN